MSFRIGIYAFEIGANFRARVDKVWIGVVHWRAFEASGDINSARELTELFVFAHTIAVLVRIYFFWRIDLFVRPRFDAFVTRFLLELQSDNSLKIEKKEKKEN